MTPAAMLFDMDGVLVNSEEVWFRVLEVAGQRFRGSPVTKEEFAPTFGQGTSADVEVFKLRCSPRQLDRFYEEEFVRHLGAVWVHPRAREVLDTVGARHIKRGLVTNTVSLLARAVLSRAGLLDALEVLGTADLVRHAKPAPDLLLHVCKELGATPQTTWMVGDSRYDAQAAHAAGMHFVGVRREGDVRIDDLGALLDLLPAQP
jgi:phosphoglycolate phosphatase/AHBA synthesis associated protein